MISSFFSLTDEGLFLYYDCTVHCSADTTLGRNESGLQNKKARRHRGEYPKEFREQFTRSVVGRWKSDEVIRETVGEQLKKTTTFYA
ncbi:hypothetical protein NPIL_304111 [Nephila pilipes]|uniref:Uncharacterized protein n=1 Tax=Nephila pilipes TaxID=299642 RepID=A0A8X6TP28_NEPPI|nr:hypothetical protein NPIL_304111 [Nephila pilipes]